MSVKWLIGGGEELLDLAVRHEHSVRIQAGEQGQKRSEGRTKLVGEGSSVDDLAKARPSHVGKEEVVAPNYRHRFHVVSVEHRESSDIENRVAHELRRKRQWRLDEARHSNAAGCCRKVGLVVDLVIAQSVKLDLQRCSGGSAVVGLVVLEWLPMIDDRSVQFLWQYHPDVTGCAFAQVQLLCPKMNLVP